MTVTYLNSLGVDDVLIPVGGDRDIQRIVLRDMRWLELYKRVVETVNSDLYRRYDDDMGCAIGAIRGTAHHYWLSERNGQGTLTRVHPINHTYFTRIDSFAFANNGFIWGGNPEIDFTLPGDAAGVYAEISRRGSEPEYVCRTPVVFDADFGAGDAQSEGESDGAGDNAVCSTYSPFHFLFPPKLIFMFSHLSPALPPGPPRLVSPMFVNRSASSGALSSAAAVGGTVTDRVEHPPKITVPAETSPQEQQRLKRSSTPVMHLDASENVPQVAVPICNASTPYMRRELVIWGDCVKLRCALSPTMLLKRPFLDSNSCFYSL